MDGSSSHAKWWKLKNSTESRYRCSSFPPITTIPLPVLTAVHACFLYFIGGIILNLLALTLYIMTLLDSNPFLSIPPITMTFSPQTVVAMQRTGEGNESIFLQSPFLMSYIKTALVDVPFAMVTDPPKMKTLSSKSSTPWKQIGCGIRQASLEEYGGTRRISCIQLDALFPSKPPMTNKRSL